MKDFQVLGFKAFVHKSGLSGLRVFMVEVSLALGCVGCVGFLGIRVSNILGIRGVVFVCFYSAAVLGLLGVFLCFGFARVCSR